MTFIVNSEFTALAALVDHYFKAKGISTQTTKIEIARHEARYVGTKVGIATAIGAILTEQRIKTYPLLENRWEMVTYWQVEQALHDFAPEFPAPDREKHAQLIDEALIVLHNVMLGDVNFRNTYAQLRRDAIMSGKYSMDMATDEDREYFQNEAARLKEQAERMAGFATSEAARSKVD